MGEKDHDHRSYNVGCPASYKTCA